MSIQIGDKLPSATLNYLKDGVQAITTSELFENKKVVLFAVPGAFTPTCSAKHLPGYVAKTDEFAKLGIDVACLSVNDAFVMGAWGRDQKTAGKVRMLADGSAAFSNAAGLSQDLTAKYLAAQDCVLIATDHSAYDWAWIAEHA